MSLIKSHEGLRLQSYRCPANILTIGYGHTGSDVKAGQTITQAEADALLATDLRKFEEGVAGAVEVPLNQHQFDALVSFAYNVGLGAFRASTLLEVLNQGNVDAAAHQFARWNKGGGRVLPGLVARRAAEAALFARLP